METHDKYEAVSDPELFRILGSGLPESPEAAMEYLQRVQRRLGGYVRSRLGNQLADRADAGQTIFLHSYEHRPAAPSDGKAFEAWLYSIARSVCVDVTRLRKPGPLPVEYDQKYTGAGPHTTVRKKEEASAVRRALESLPPDLAALFLQRFVEHASTEDLAAQRGEHPRTTRKKLTLAKSLAKIALIAAGITDAA